MATKDIEIKVKYVPDTSQLKNAMTNVSGLNFKGNSGDVKKELVKPIQNAIKEVNKALNSGADTSTLLELFKKLGKEADAAKVKASAMLNELNTVFNSSGNQKLLKDLEEYQKKIAQVEKDINNWNNKFGKSAFKQLKTSLYDSGKGGVPEARKELASMEEQLKIGKQLTEDEKNRYDILKKYVNLWNERQTTTPKSELEAKLTEYKTKEKEILGQVQTSSFNIEKTKEYTQTMTQASNISTYATGEVTKLNGSLKAQSEIVDKSKKEVAKFGDILTGTFLGTSLSNLLQTGLSRGIEFFKDYDETLTRTMMVTGMTRDEVNELTSSYNGLANQLKSTTKDVAAAQLVFYQQGLGTSEALEMTKASLAISKTGGIEAGEAADRLTSAIRGYKMAASDAMDIADKMSALDAAAASSVDELTVAMQKSASQAKMAGLDLDYYMAYLSTMQEVTREAPENIGTAMKSITSRLQEITNIGKVEEDGTTFSNVAKALNSIGIAAVDSSGQLRNLQDIMNELGPMWKTLDRNHQAYIATVLAGNRQQSRFIALMDNYDRAMELVNVSQNASGESAKQLRAYNQGLEASFTALNNAWQQFATKVADSDTIKSIVDLLTDLIELFNKIPKSITSTVVPLVGLLKLFTTFSKMGNILSSFKDWGIKKLGIDTLSEDFGGLNKELSKVSKTATNAWNSVKKFIDGFGNDSIKKASRAIDENSGSIERNTIVQGQNTKVKQADDSVAMQEAAEAQINSNAQETMGDAYRTATKAIKAQEKVMSSNGDAYIQEANRAMREAQARIKANEEEVRILEKKSKDIRHSKNLEVAEVRASYERKVKDPNSWKPGGELYEEAVASLKEKGALSDVEQFSLFDDDPEKLIRQRMESIAKEYGLGYNHIQEEAKKWKSENKDILSNNLSVESLKKDIEQDKNLIEKTQKELNNYFKQEGKTRSSKNTKQRKGTDLKVAANEQLQAFIQGNENGDVSFKQIKDLFSNKNIGNISKITAVFGKLNVMGGLVAGSLAQMGASFIGLDDDMSSALGTSIGLASTFSSLAPPFGAIVAASIGLIASGLSNLWPSTEKTQEKIAKLQQEMDELAQKEDNIKNSLNTYEELKNKLNKTEEETEQLRNATESLASTIPSAVTGYDKFGNAIISTAKAMNELNYIQEQQIENSKKQLTQFNNLQKSQISGWEKAGSVLAEVIGTLMTVSGNPLGLILLGGGIADQMTWNSRQIKANKKIIKENYTEIYGQLQQGIIEVIEEGNEKKSEARKRLSDSLLNTLIGDALSADTVSGSSIETIKKRTEEIFNKLDSGSLDIIVDLSDRLKLSAEITEMTWNELKKQVIKQLKARTALLDLTDEEFETLVKVTLDASWDMDINVGSIQEELQEAIDNSTNDNWKVKAEEFKNALGNMDREILELLNDMGLLNANFSELFSLIGKNKGLEDIFRDDDGNIDKTKGSLALLTKAYEQRDETELLELQKREKELEEKQKLLEKNGQAINFNDTKPTNEFNYINDRTNVGEDKVDKELDSVRGKIAEINEELKFSDNVINQIIASFEGAEVKTFTELAEQIRQTASEMEEVNSIAQSLDENSGFLTGDSLATMFDILGRYENMDKMNLEDWNLWNHAIDSINDGLSIQEGKLHLEEGAIAGINELVQIQNKLKYQQILASIEQAQQELDLQNQILQTQKNAVDAAIKELDTTKDSKQAQSKLNEVLDEQLAMFNTERVVREVKANNTILDYADQFAIQYSKIMAAAQNGNYNSGDFKKATADYDSILNKMRSDMKEQFSAYYNEDIDIYRKNLEALSNDLQNKINMNQQIIDGQLELKKRISEYLADGNVNLANTFSEAEKATSDYNGKLERTLTLLEKIEGLQHTIDENETFKSLYDGYNGEAYGRLLMSNLKLAQEQYEVYKDLFEMQQEMTNQAAGDLLDSPYGEMFKIQENGDLGWANDSMYDKYKGLPGDMQEDIDNLVDAYQKQRDELRKTESSLAGYAEAVKSAREELVQIEIDVENELVEAIKNREKILHEARIKALEDEMDMIDKAVQARKKAREDENDASDLYQAQENLRRATLDSSGKNNAQLLQLQQELEDKQLEISEKRFEDDMEDRKQWLQDTKDAETETYDYRLETMTWYWEQVQIIQEQGTEAMMLTLIQWNEQYRTVSKLQQEEMVREWEFSMTAMKTAADLGAELGKLTNDINAVTSEVESMNISIQKLPGTWEKATAAANNYRAAASGALGYSYSGGSNSNNNSSNNESNNSNDKKKASSPAGIPKDPNNLTIYELKNGRLKSKNACAPPSGYSEGAIPFEVGATFYDKDRKAYYKGADGRIYLAQDFKKVYKMGGYVDYTGPAWVDGTKTKPEAFLNPYQTEKIGALAKILDNNVINNVSGDSNISFGSISFNVASMSSAADGKRALEVFVQGANDLMAKKGINTKINMRLN